ncbi:hypothetical protein C8Q77DRAFT_244761 [Trametes polyzona]|nr:hypothetical protein C8Q77DRAFT_244761 [Trametes polyzona]
MQSWVRYRGQAGDAPWLVLLAASELASGAVCYRTPQRVSACICICIRVCICPRGHGPERASRAPAAPRGKIALARQAEIVHRQSPTDVQRTQRRTRAGSVAADGRAARRRLLLEVGVGGASASCPVLGWLGGSQLLSSSERRAQASFSRVDDSAMPLVRGRFLRRRHPRISIIRIRVGVAPAFARTRTRTRRAVGVLRGRAYACGRKER